MAARYLRKQTWWIRFYHPRTGDLVRHSLGTCDSARAELLRQRIELEVRLRDHRFDAAEIPAPILQEIANSVGIDTTAGALVSPELALGRSIPVPPAQDLPAGRTLLDKALKDYFDLIRVDNAAMHVQNKISILRRFIGVERAEQFVTDGDQKARARRLQRPAPGFFTGEYLDEITKPLLKEFFQQLAVSTRTKRHYREFFHHFFQYCLRADLYRSENWHCPNPTGALPSFTCKNNRIIFLNPPQVETQLEILKPYPCFHIAAALMIYAGLRRAETLWLTRDAIAADLSFLSIVNKLDPDSDVESSLKTGERVVTIIQPLRDILRQYLATLKGPWLVPSPNGKRWNGDAFARRLRVHNQKAALKWTCLHYRHTFATDRAAG